MSSEETTASFKASLPSYKGWFTKACTFAEEVLQDAQKALDEGSNLSPIDAELCVKASKGLEERVHKCEEILFHLIHHDGDNIDVYEAALTDLSTRQSKWTRKLSRYIATYQRQSQGGGASEASNTPPPTTQYLPHLKPPDPLRGEATSVEFNSWHQAWTDYSNLINLKNYDRQAQLGILRSSLSADMLQTLQYTLDVGETSHLTVAEIVDLIREHIKKSRNVHLHRYDLMQRKQQEGEKFDDFVANLKKLAVHAEPCRHCKDDQLVTLIICGLRDNSTRQKLLAKSDDLTLEKTINIARSAEAAKTSDMSLTGAQDRFVNQNSHRPAPAPRKFHQGPPKPIHDPCQACGYFQKHNREDCFAGNATCSKCDMQGHFTKLCPGPKEDRQSKNKVSALVVRDITHKRAAPTVSVEVCSAKTSSFNPVPSLPDTGGEASVGGVDLLKATGIKMSKLGPPPEDSIIGVTGTKLKCIGTLHAKIKLNNTVVEENIFICPQAQGLLLAWYVCQDLGIIHKDYPKQLQVKKTSWEPMTTDQDLNDKKEAQYHIRALKIQRTESHPCDPLPAVPFAEVEVHLFQKGGQDFLIAVDRLSGWPLVWPLSHSTTTSKIITYLRRMFVTYSVPARLRSDAGPHFTSREFKNFMGNWGVEHQLSSPHYPQSNGLADHAAVKAMKDLAAKCTENGVLNEEELCGGLIEFRNTPRQCGQSPAQIIYDRDITSIVPQLPMKDSWIAVQERRDLDFLDVQEHYNRCARKLPELRPGTEVFVQNELTRRWDKVGIVVEKWRYGSYLIRLPSGRTLVRNLRFIRAKGQATTAAVPEPEGQESQAPPQALPRRSSRQKTKPDRFGYI